MKGAKYNTKPHISYLFRKQIDTPESSPSTCPYSTFCVGHCTIQSVFVYFADRCSASSLAGQHSNQIQQNTRWFHSNHNISSDVKEQSFWHYNKTSLAFLVLSTSCNTVNMHFSLPKGKLELCKMKPFAGVL